VLLPETTAELAEPLTEAIRQMNPIDLCFFLQQMLRHKQKPSKLVLAAVADHFLHLLKSEGSQMDAHTISLFLHCYLKLC